VERARNELHKSHDYLPRGPHGTPTPASPPSSTPHRLLAYADDASSHTLDARIARIDRRRPCLPLQRHRGNSSANCPPPHRRLPLPLGGPRGPTGPQYLDRSHPATAEHESIGMEVLEELAHRARAGADRLNKADRVPAPRGPRSPCSRPHGQGLDGSSSREERLLPNFRLSARRSPGRRARGWRVGRKNPMTVRIVKEADGCVVEYWMRL